MKPLLTRAGINEEAFLRPVKDIGLFDDSEIRSLYEWMKGVYDKEYKELYTVFKLPADDTLWDKYVTFRIEGLPEQKLFNQSARELRRVWNKPYRPERKINNAASKEADNGDTRRNQDNPQPVGVQSES
jgi:hypothetical protein